MLVSESRVPYPSKLSEEVVRVNDQELLEANEHMPTDEVKRDLHATEVEVVALRAMLPGVAVLEDRVLRMRVESGISRRDTFIAALKRILDLREKLTNTQSVAG